ncbi:MAG TPA: alpha/beta fold hydrolase [Ktedonobacteraceae bacterium]|nr:alpha/beta fold hydrolase [Ktedonobacteraceae bacterium]
MYRREYVLSFLKRLTIVIFLVLIVPANWFLYSAGILSDSVAAHSATSSHQAAKPGNTPEPSYKESADMKLIRYSGELRTTLAQRTSGLHPGRGEPVPVAKDVQDLPVVDISFHDWRGFVISGWLALQTPQAPVIILTHGTPGNRVSMVQRAAFLYKHGYNVLLFDFQSYGKSQGILSTLGMVESEDILAAISYLHALPDTTYSKIGVLGLSMGATAAVLAASRTDDIAALVAESCPVDATRVTADVPDEDARTADQLVVEATYGVDITQARPIDVVNKLAGHTAIFFVNGDTDDITPLPGMQDLYQTAGMPKQYWVVPGAGHAQSFSTDPTGYALRVSTFFDTYLRS